MPEHSPIGVRPSDATHDDLIVDLTTAERRRRFRSGGDNVALLRVDTHAGGLADQLRHALDVATELVIVTDPVGHVRFANRAAREHLDLPDDAQTCELVDVLLHGPAGDAVWSAIATSRAWHGERSVPRADGSIMHLAISVRPARTPTGDTHGLTVIAHDRSEHVALERALAHQLTHDALTGLANRQHLLLQLDRTLADPTSCGALLLIDIDEFRTVSNSLGHEAGNRLLMAFASRLSRAFPGDCLLARVGGDEFAVYCAGPQDVDGLAARVEQAATAPFTVHGDEIHVSVVVGIAVVAASDHPQRGAELLRRADAAIYDAKSRGRGGFGVFDPAVGAVAAGRLTTARELRRALRDQEFEVHYQPKIALDTGAITGAEALIRWRLPDGTMRSPISFLDVAEDTGLIIPIGRWVLEQACRVAERLRRDLPRTGDIGMAVNLSVRQLGHPDFIEELAQVVCTSGIDPRRVELELTESMVMDDIDTSTAMLHRLKQLGTHIAIDDFGTGHSSLRYLQRLPVDVLKIDRSFVSGLATDDADQTAIVTAVIHLAQALRLKTVAEGVETAAQLAELRRLGCDAAQGYFVARPLPEDEFLALVAAGPIW